MITLTIDRQGVTVPEGTTVLEAARSIGIRIPSLCYSWGFKPSTSCMVCVVRVEGMKSLVPACGLHVSEGMNVTTRSDEIQKARTAAVELLLSDHAGDCLGPCEIGCPAKMDIPAMLRQIASGDLKGAIATVKKDIPLPAILGRICPAPCEKVCRRSEADGAVGICALKRFVADTDLACASPYQPAAETMTGLKAAVVGAGPAGLSAAYYLQLGGVACDVYDDHPHPGGALRYAELDRHLLPESVVEQEIGVLLGAGVCFHGDVRLGRDVTLSELSTRYDAVVLAVGANTGIDDESVPTKDGRIAVNRSDYSVRDNLWAAGACIGSRNLAVRAVADGKEAAQAILRKLLKLDPSPARAYNHRLGRPDKPLSDRFLAQASTAPRWEAENRAGLTPQQAAEQAGRCLHCDCGKKNACTLRDLATEFGAAQKTYAGDRSATQADQHGRLLYNASKCVKCGLCVQLARRDSQANFAFEGRGFGMRIAAPLNRVLNENSTETAQQYVSLCPTGALTLKQKSE